MQLYLSKGEFGLPHAFYYLSSTPANEAAKEMYLSLIKNMLELAEIHDPTAPEVIWDIETKLAAASKLRDEHLQYASTFFDSVVHFRATTRHDLPLPAWDLPSLEKDFPNFPWRAYFTRWGYAELATKYDQITVTNRPWMKSFDDL